MNNTNTLWSSSYVANHTKSQVTPMGSNMLEDFEPNKEDNSKALLITKSFTWSSDTMFTLIHMVCNLNSSNVILQVQSFSICQIPSFGIYFTQHEHDSTIACFKTINIQAFASIAWSQCHSKKCLVYDHDIQGWTRSTPWISKGEVTSPFKHSKLLMLPKKGT
jgi:hypothetical protein